MPAKEGTQITIPPTVVMDVELSVLFSNRSKVRRINTMLLHFRACITEAGSRLVSVVIWEQNTLKMWHTY